MKLLMLQETISRGQRRWLRRPTFFSPKLSRWVKLKLSAWKDDDWAHLDPTLRGREEDNFRGAQVLLRDDGCIQPGRVEATGLAEGWRGEKQQVFYSWGKDQILWETTLICNTLYLLLLYFFISQWNLLFDEWLVWCPFSFFFFALCF